MTTRELLRTVNSVVKSYGFSPQVEHDQASVSVTMRTTSTRATSAETRLKLMVAELAKGRRILVKKELVGERPKRRDSLATWRLLVQPWPRTTLTAREVAEKFGLGEVRVEDQEKAVRETVGR
jgi:hypothetical protein